MKKTTTEAKSKYTISALKTCVQINGVIEIKTQEELTKLAETIATAWFCYQNMKGTEDGISMEQRH